MPKSIAERVVRKPGPPRKPKTAAEAKLQEHESQTRSQRRRVSGKDRAFIARFRELGFSNPDQAATDAGFKEPFAGGKLVLRLGELIAAERVAAQLGSEMEASEALLILAGCARDFGHPHHKDYLRMQLQVQGLLSDKPVGAKDKKQLARQVLDAVDRIQSELRKRPGVRARVRAAIGVDAQGRTRGVIQTDVSEDPGDAPPDPASPDPAGVPSLPAASSEPDPPSGS